MMLPFLEACNEIEQMYDGKLFNHYLGGLFIIRTGVDGFVSHQIPISYQYIAIRAAEISNQSKDGGSK